MRTTSALVLRCALAAARPPNPPPTMTTRGTASDIDRPHRFCPHRYVVLTRSSNAAHGKWRAVSTTSTRAWEKVELASLPSPFFATPRKKFVKPSEAWMRSNEKQAFTVGRPVALSGRHERTPLANRDRVRARAAHAASGGGIGTDRRAGRCSLVSRELGSVGRRRPTGVPGRPIEDSGKRSQ